MTQRLKIYIQRLLKKDDDTKFYLLFNINLAISIKVTFYEI